MPLLLKCHEASILSSEKLDRRLTFAEWVSWRIHVMVCSPCMLFQRQVKLLHRITVNGGVFLEDLGSEGQFGSVPPIDGLELKSAVTLSEEVKRKIRAIL